MVMNSISNRQVFPFLLLLFLSYPCQILNKPMLGMNRYDAVTYLKYLDSLRASESFRSVWIFAESSYKIFDYAKKRVYRFGRSDAGKSVGQSKTTATKKRKLDDTSKEKEGAHFLVIVVLHGGFCLLPIFINCYFKLFWDMSMYG